MLLGQRRKKDAKLEAKSSKVSANGAFDLWQYFVDDDVARTIKNAKHKCVVKMCKRGERDLIKDEPDVDDPMRPQAYGSAAYYDRKPQSDAVENGMAKRASIKLQTNTCRRFCRLSGPFACCCRPDARVDPAARPPPAP